MQRFLQQSSANAVVRWPRQTVTVYVDANTDTVLPIPEGTEVISVSWVGALDLWFSTRGAVTLPASHLDSASAADVEWSEKDYVANGESGCGKAAEIIEPYVTVSMADIEALRSGRLVSCWVQLLGRSQVR